VDGAELMNGRDAAMSVLPTPAMDFLSPLIEISAAIDSARSTESLLKILARRTAEACGVERCSIFLWRDNRLVPAMAQFASGATAPNLWQAFAALEPCGLDDAPVLARALRERRVVLVQEPLEGGLFPPHWIETFDPGSLLVVPLLRRDRFVGVLVLDNRSGGAPITEAHVRLARAIGAQAALAIASARLEEETRNRLRETETLRTVGRVIGSTLDLQEVARRITREAARVVGADSAGIYVEDNRSLRPLAGYRIPREFLETLRTEAIVHPDTPRPGRFLGEPRKSLWSDDVRNDPAFGHEVFRRFPVQSIVVTPLQALDEWVGVLVCAWWTQRRRLAPGELRLIEGIATQAALAIINARLYAKADAMAVQRERMRMDSILHDTLSQTLFSVALRLGLFLHECRSAKLRPKLEAIKQDVALMMAQVRQLLAPGPTGDHGFSARIQGLVHEFRNLSGIPAEFTQHGDGGRLGPQVQEALQKTFEEGLAVVARQGHQGRVTILLELSTDEVQFELADDDGGAPAGVERLTEPPADWGFDRTVQRIKSLSGKIEFWNRPSGFRLRGTLPLP